MSLKQNSIIITLLLAVALLLSSCNRRTVFSHYEHTSMTGWEANDSLGFDFAPFRKTSDYEESVGLRISGDYPFMDLSLLVEQWIYPSGIHQLDTLHARLIERDGISKGKGFSYHQYEFPLRKIHIEADDSLHFRIRHNMKRELLTGIADIGIIIRICE